jgi:diguanylate cyclase
MQKLVSQLEVQAHAKNSKTVSDSSSEISDEIGTVLQIIDQYSKTTFDLENRPQRQTREMFDKVTRNLITTTPQTLEKNLFEIRQNFSSYRIEESAYVQKSIDELRNIIWNLVDQMGEDFNQDRNEDFEIKECLEKLREAVEAQSVVEIKSYSQVFIEKYTSIQSKRQLRKSKRASTVRKNLSSVKKQLIEAQDSLHVDHLTQAFNRKFFEDKLKQAWSLNQAADSSAYLLMLDIDHFKKINDSYGHDVGDFVIQECVRVLKEVFNREQDYVCRIGGEEFAVIISGANFEYAKIKAEAALQKFRTETYVKEDMRLNFTVSMGIGELMQNEPTETWLKRTDQALYGSKHNGRNRITIAPKHLIRTVA